MTPLVFIEVRDGTATQDSLGVLAKAASLSAETAAILCGHEVGHLAAGVGRYGARRVLVVDHPSLAEPLAALHIDALAQVRRHHPFDLLLCAASALACDVAAGLAARLEAGIAFGLVDIAIRDGVAIGTGLADNDSVLAEIAWTTEVGIALFRPHAVTPATVGDTAPLVERLDIALPADTRAPRLVARSSLADIGERGGPPLDAAEVIVSGGRGLGAPEHLGLVRELASLLGGVPAVSLPLVELGWVPRAMQVGQTGTIVQPRLYVACGISGQIQHRVGMEGAGTIVAINRDAAAPIMGFCDLAVVGDLHKIVPALIALLRERRVTSASRQRVSRT